MYNGRVILRLSMPTTVHEWIAETDFVFIVPGFRVDTCRYKTVLLEESSPIRPELHEVPLPIPTRVWPPTSINHVVIAPIKVTSTREPLEKGNLHRPRWRMKLSALCVTLISLSAIS